MYNENIPSKNHHWNLFFVHSTIAIQITIHILMQLLSYHTTTNIYIYQDFNHLSNFAYLQPNLGRRWEHRMGVLLWQPHLSAFSSHIPTEQYANAVRSLALNYQNVPQSLLCPTSHRAKSDINLTSIHCNNNIPHCDPLPMMEDTPCWLTRLYRWHSRDSPV